MDGQRSLAGERGTRGHRYGSLVFYHHIAGVAYTVTVRIQLVGVVHGRAVVGIVQHVAFRLRTVDHRVVRIAEAILVKVSVVGGRGRPDTGIQRIAVVGIGYAVTVDVVVADVTQSVAVQIGLIGVGCGGTVVVLIGHAVTVGIRRGSNDLDKQRVGIGRVVVVRHRKYHFVVAGGEASRGLRPGGATAFPRPGVGDNTAVGIA